MRGRGGESERGGREGEGEGEERGRDGEGGRMEGMEKVVEWRGWRVWEKGEEVREINYIHGHHHGDCVQSGGR